MNTLYDIRSGTLVKSTLYTNGLRLKDSIAYNPLSLFKDGKQGVIYDPSDKSTLFQDVAGTVPVTKDGDPVALMRDKSGNGNHATMGVSTARPIYRTDGILHRLTFDGVDDYLMFNKNTFASHISQLQSLAYKLNADGIYPTLISGGDSDAGIELQHLSDVRIPRIVFMGSTGAVGVAGTIATTLGSNLVRTIEWNKGAGILKDFSNRILNSNTSVPVSAEVPQPPIHHRIGSIGTTFAAFDMYGYIGISDDLSPTAIADVEQYLASKSGVTL